MSMSGYHDAWPSGLDLMARLAGLKLRERWGDWDRSPFSAASGGHISIYERIPATIAPCVHIEV